MRLIDADTVRDDFMAAVYMICSDDRTNDRANRIIDLFDDLPTIEAEPVRHGKWEQITMELWGWKCGNCSKVVYSNRKCDLDNYKYPYCPNCGAKMDLEENENEP